MRRPIVISSLILGAGLLYFFVVSPLFRLERAWSTVHPLAIEAEVAVRTKNDSALLRLVPKMLPPLSEAHSTLSRLRYLGWIPVVGTAYRSGAAVLNTVYWTVAAVDRPVILKAVSDSKTTAMGKITRTLITEWPTVRSSLDVSLSDLKTASAASRHIRSTALPLALAGPAQRLAKVSREVEPFIEDGATIAHHMSLWGQLLGIHVPARYLILFQNSGELRASGGLITAYGTLTVRDGHIGGISPINTARLPVYSTIPAPFPFRHYFGQRVLSFENASDNPDVPQVAHTIYALLKANHQLGPVQGIIFVNTGLVDSLLKEFGPLRVPKTYTAGRTVILTASNANVKMESIAEHSGLSHSLRKQFIGAVMGELVHRALAVHGSDEGRFLLTIGAALHHKALVIYVNPPQGETLLRQWGWAGEIVRHVSGDYLEVVNENLGGHKDNFFLRQDVTARITEIHGRMLQTTDITWIMPVVADGWLTVGYPGWVELYVPKGSRLISITGAGTRDDRTIQDQTLDKTIFEGTFYIGNKKTKKSPPVVETMVVRYWLPQGMSSRRLLVQLQPGVPSQKLVVTVGRQTIANVTERSDVTLHW